MDENQSEKGTVTLKKSTLWKASTFVFVVLFVISLFTGGFGIGSDSDTTGRAIAPTPTAPSPSAGGVGNIKIDLGSEDPILGDADAPVTIVEFSDFQCPFCGRAAMGAVAQLKVNEIEDGIVKLAYLDFPLTSIHPYAQKAGEAGQCAHDQGKFWEYHDKLFENQAALSTDDLKGYAASLELDTNEFNECLDSGKHAQEVKDDTTQATNAGGRGTPYFVVIGPEGSQVVSGAQPYQNFQAAISAVQ